MLRALERRILVPFQCMASILFACESLMDPRIQVRLDKYQKCRTIISQTSLLSRYTGSETDADSHSRSIQRDIVNQLSRFEPTTSTTPPRTTPDIDATNWATETSQKKDIQVALILTTTDAVHVVYWFLFNAWHLFRSQVKALYECVSFFV